MKHGFVFSVAFSLIVGTARAGGGSPDPYRLDSCTYDEVSQCVGTLAPGKRINVVARTLTSNCPGEYCHGYPELTQDSGVGACYNLCEDCCLYEFTIKNGSTVPNLNIDAVRLCTDRGCSDQTGPVPDMFVLCDVLPWVRPDHFCEYCGNTHFRGNSVIGPAWVIDPSCPRIVPPTPGGTLGDGSNDSLCRTNCLRLQPADPTNSHQLLWQADSLVVKFGLTGDCARRKQLRDFGDSLYGKCVWVCVRFTDGSTLCCRIELRHCNCRNPDHTSCDCPRDTLCVSECWQQYPPDTLIQGTDTIISDSNAELRAQCIAACPAQCVNQGDDQEPPPGVMPGDVPSKPLGPYRTPKPCNCPPVIGSAFEPAPPVPGTADSRSAPEKTHQTARPPLQQQR